MKLIQILYICFFLLLCGDALAEGPWKPQGSFVSYGVQGKGMWHVGHVGKNPEAAKTNKRPLLQGLYAKGVHPFLWQRELDNSYANGEWGDELLWHIHGSPEALNQELTKFDPNGESSFIWETAPKAPTRIYITMGSDGRGRVKIFQGTQIIASLRSTGSASGAVRLPAGVYEIDFKRPSHTSSEIKVRNSKGNLVGAYMGKVLHIPALNAKGRDRGIYLHAGSIGSNSHGCYRISTAAIHWVYDMIDPGAYKPVVTVSDS